MQSNIAWLDDEKEILDEISFNFELDDIPIDCYSNPQEVIEAIEAGRWNYKILITDMKMPIVGGETVIKKLREKDKNIVIYVASGHISEEQKNTMKEQYNVKEFFDKPFDLEKIIDETKRSNYEI